MVVVGNRGGETGPLDARHDRRVMPESSRHEVAGDAGGWYN